MKITLYIFCMAFVVVTIRASPSLRRSKRSFKDEIDFGHGFGKRTDHLGNLLKHHTLSDTSDRPLLSNSELAKVIAESRELSEALVAKFVDINGDGYVSKKELFPEGVNL
ncbi:uncharacterized protein LOC135499494 [Lineus longissimus]|uniref:uncharacterized protein LOC135499494 n=1 Tax=Lineus longissimus TaxID=88925 RepID=UPI002B4E6908